MTETSTINCSRERRTRGERYNFCGTPSLGCPARFRGNRWADGRSAWTRSRPLTRLSRAFGFTGFLSPLSTGLRSAQSKFGLPFISCDSWFNSAALRLGGECISARLEAVALRQAGCPPLRVFVPIRIGPAPSARHICRNRPKIEFPAPLRAASAFRSPVDVAPDGAWRFDAPTRLQRFRTYGAAGVNPFRVVRVVRG